MLDGINVNEITVTNRYGYAILTDNATGKAMVCEPTMAGPNIIAFVIRHRCDDYETAHLVALMLNDSGVHPTNYTEGNDATDADPAAPVPVPPALASAAAADPGQG